MKVLVTGSSGQLGKAFRRLAGSSANEYIFTDICPCDGVSVLDITDPLAVQDAIACGGVEVIINCAGYTDVNRAEEEQENAFLVNSGAVGILAEKALENNLLLIHVSTDYVFDGQANVPYVEDAPTFPLNAYGKTKLAGEKAIIESGCRHMIFRTSWLYDSSSRNFFTVIAEKTASQPQVAVVADQVGTPTYAPDLAQFIDHILECGHADRTGLYHYSGEGLCSWYDFAAAICRALGHLSSVVPCRSGDFPSKAVRPHYSVLDKSKVKKTFGVEIPHWADSLEICVAEYMGL